jgi:hypothetical protein
MFRSLLPIMDLIMWLIMYFVWHLGCLLFNLNGATALPFLQYTRVVFLYDIFFNL